MATSNNNAVASKHVSSLSSYLVPRLAQEAFCIQQDCLLSHKLVAADSKNFGKQYSDAQHATNMFPRICNHCMLSKFGLYDSNHKEGMTFMNCPKDFTQGTDNVERAEGPFLRAFKPVANIIDDINVVFEKNTIILPCGQLLIEILTAQPEVLYNKNKKIPLVKVSTTDDIESGTTAAITAAANDDNDTPYKLNPYLFSYFKHLHDRQTLPANRNKRDYKFLEDILCNGGLDSSNELACTTEVDLLLIANLINPIAALSNYISLAETVALNDDKTLTVSIGSNTRPVGTTDDEELPDQEDSSFCKLNVVTRPLEKIPGIEARQLQHVNGVFFSYTLNMRQLISNRFKGLLHYFSKKVAPLKDIKSASGLHVASFCLPHCIMQGSNVVRKLHPNCAWIECIGLVATSDICENELLIIDETVPLEHFVRLKLNQYSEAIQYASPTVDDTAVTDADGSSYDFEVRKNPLLKACLYANG